MSIPLYDKAVGDKIKNWVLKKDVTIFYPEESMRFFQQTADTNKDKISLPLISISRDSDIDINITSRNPKTFNGKIFNSINGQSDHLNAVPITLKYQIDIYTRYRAEADEYFRNFVFNLINRPRITIDIPYNNSGLKQSSFLELDSNASDNSDLPERLISGQFSRMTLRATLKDAYLYSYTFRDIPKIDEVSVYVDEDGSSHIKDVDNCVEDTIIKIDNN